MRKHHPRAAVILSRLLWAWSYVPRAAAALLMREHRAGWYWLHARRALRPGRGDGMREAADAYNRQRASLEPATPDGSGSARRVSR